MQHLSDRNIGLVFGTDTGNTEEIGEKIIACLSKHGCVVEILNVTDTSAAEIQNFDVLIMGIPTWDFGGIQEDWEDFEDSILSTNLSNTIVALYGLGDQLGYGDYFVDAMGWLHERAVKAGATIIGEWSTEGYDFEASLATDKEKTKFCGLAIDDDQQFHLTDERIGRWVAQITSEYTQLIAA